MSEKLARLPACWHANLKNLHVIWHFGSQVLNINMPYGTLARKNEKLARFWHVDTHARWHVNHARTQARWYVDYVRTQARMTRDFANLLDDQWDTWLVTVEDWPVGDLCKHILPPSTYLCTANKFICINWCTSRDEGSINQKDHQG